MPGRTIHDSARLDDLVAAARAAPGRVVTHQGWTARAAGESVWVALPPAGTVERTMDLLSGLQHEQALLRGAGELDHAVIRGLAVLLASQLGVAAPRVPAGLWRDRLSHLMEISESVPDVPQFDGIGALDPDASFVLANRGAGRFEVSGDQLWLVLSARGIADPVCSQFAAPGGRVAIG